MKKVKIKKIGKLSIIRKILRHIPYFCSSCGKMYVKIHINKMNILMPLPQNGKGCPDGHEGYIMEFIGVGYVKHIFNHLK
jgi:hypothetical protein